MGAQSTMCFLYKCEDQHPCKCQVGVAAAYNLSSQETETGAPWDKLAS